jgi:modulator of FtsH protease
MNSGRAALRHCQKIASLFAVSYGSIAEWNTLLAVQAGAAATLTGLVFVALSINLNRIMSVPGLPGRGAESIMQFLQVFFISTVALIPRQPERTFAIEVLFIAAASGGAQVTAQVRYLKVRTGHPWSWFVSRALMSQFATIPFGVAGVTLLLGLPGAIYWLVPGFIVSFLAGIVSAWVLLVEILR